MTGNSTKLVIGIPAYNAERGISDVLSRIVNSVEFDSIVVVDDGSSDRTAESVREFDWVRLIQHDQNRGYGAAQKTICSFFVDDECFDDDDILVFIHADGEMCPEEIPNFCTPLWEDSTLDMVFGSRDLRLARSTGFISRGHRRALWKRATDRMSTAVLNVLLGLSVTTYFGGFRAIKKRAIRQLDVSIFDSGHIFDQQFIAHSRALISMIEVPISNVDNGSISSYSFPRAGLRLAKFAIRARAFRQHMKARKVR